MSSVINSLSYTLLLKGKYESINSFVSRGLYVYTIVSFMHYIHHSRALQKDHLQRA